MKITCVSPVDGKIYAERAAILPAHRVVEALRESASA